MRPIFQKKRHSLEIKTDGNQILPLREKNSKAIIISIFKILKIIYITHNQMEFSAEKQNKKPKPQFQQ